jgi:glyoxylase I family protein
LNPMDPVHYKGIAHASVLVRDTDRALSFYCAILGMTVDPSRPDLGFPGAWLRVGAQQIHLLQLPNPDPVDARPQHGGRDRHVAIYVHDLDTVSARLESAAVAYSRSRSGRRALFCRDPDGNAIEIIETRT